MARCLWTIDVCIWRMFVFIYVVVTVGVCDLSMAMLLDCLHTLGILFSVKHVFSIECNHLCALGAGCLSCSTSTSSMHADLLFLSVAINFLYASSVNG